LALFLVVNGGVADRNRANERKVIPDPIDDRKFQE